MYLYIFDVELTTEFFLLQSFLEHYYHSLFFCYFGWL